MFSNINKHSKNGNEFIIQSIMLHSDDLEKYKTENPNEIFVICFNANKLFEYVGLTDAKSVCFTTFQYLVDSIFSSKYNNSKSYDLMLEVMQDFIDGNEIKSRKLHLSQNETYIFISMLECLVNVTNNYIDVRNDQVFKYVDTFLLNKIYVRYSEFEKELTNIK